MVSWVLLMGLLFGGGADNCLIEKLVIRNLLNGRNFNIGSIVDDQCITIIKAGIGM